MAQTYEVLILNWKKNNKNHKPGMKHFMLKNNFFSDQKIANCSPIEVALFTYLMCIASESSTDRVQINSKTLPKQFRMGDKTLANCLLRLESFQLVSGDFKVKEGGVIKEKLIKDKLTKVNKTPEGGQQKTSEASPRSTKSTEPDGTNLVIARYCEVWKARYKSDRSPPMLPHHAASVKKLVKSVGKDQAIKLVETFLDMPDHWYVTRRHDIPTLMGNLNAITQFSETGKMFTKRDINQLDLSVTNNNTIEAIRRGEV